MATRKTYDVNALIDKVNALISTDLNTTREQREVLCHLLSSVLHETNQYRGYSYAQGTYDAEKTDETRRIYIKN
jgi:hypothetical protein